jgi:hypothetical protein
MLAMMATSACALFFLAPTQGGKIQGADAQNADAHHA